MALNHKTIELDAIVPLGPDTATISPLLTLVKKLGGTDERDVYKADGGGMSYVMKHTGRSFDRDILTELADIRHPAHVAPLAVATVANTPQFYSEVLLIPYVPGIVASNRVGALLEMREDELRHVLWPIADLLRLYGERGLVHADPTPGNIVYRRGWFGSQISYLIDTDQTKRRGYTGPRNYTPGYVDLRTLNHAADPSDDVRALATTIVSLAYAKRAEQFSYYDLLPSNLFEVLPTVAPFVIRALSENPSERPSMAELATVLKDKRKFFSLSSLHPLWAGKI
jgi:serine/threonine protein kinase